MIRRSFAKPRRARQAVPRLEALEDRWVPSATVGIADLNASPAVQDHALTITSNNAADEVVITDDGTGDGITVLVNGSDVTPDAIAGKDIRHIVVQGGGGADTISYELTEADGLSREVVLNGGNGNDTIQVNLGSAGKLVNSNVQVTAKGLQGQDSITANLNGAIEGNSTVRVRAEGGQENDDITLDYESHTGGTSEVDVEADGGTGDDTLMADLDGDVEGASDVSVKLEGGKGADQFTVTSTGKWVEEGASFDLDIASGPDNDSFGAEDTACTVNFDSLKVDGAFGARVRGGPGDDIFDLHFHLRSDSTGEFDLRAESGPGDDTLAAEIDANGSSAAIGADVRGGSHDDILALSILDAEDADLDATLDGGAHDDTYAITDNVIAHNVEF